MIEVPDIGDEDMHDGSAHAGIISLTNKAVPAGAALTGAGWFTSELALGVAGLCIAVIFGCIGVYYRYKDDRRKEHADTRKKEFYEWHRNAYVEKLPKENGNG